MLRNLRYLKKCKPKNAEIFKLEKECKMAESAGDITKACIIRERIFKLLNESNKIARESGIIGKGEVGAKAIQEVPLKLKEMGSILNKWRESLIKAAESPESKQFLKNVEGSKVTDRGIIESTHKTINPFANYNGGSMSL